MVAAAELDSRHQEDNKVVVGGEVEAEAGEAAALDKTLEGGMVLGLAHPKFV